MNQNTSMRWWWSRNMANSDEENQVDASNRCIQLYHRMKNMFKATRTPEDASLREHLSSTSQRHQEHLGSTSQLQHPELPDYYKRQQNLIDSTELQPTTGCCYYIKEDNSLDELKLLMETRLTHNKGLDERDSSANTTIIALGTFLFVEINAYRPMIEEELKKTPTCQEWLIFTPLILMFIVFTIVLCKVAHGRLTNTLFEEEFDEVKVSDMIVDMHNLLKGLEVPIGDLVNLKPGEDQERKLRSMVHICRVIKAPTKKLATLYKRSVIVAGFVVVAFQSFQVGRGLFVLC